MRSGVYLMPSSNDFGELNNFWKYHAADKKITFIWTNGKMQLSRRFYSGVLIKPWLVYTLRLVLII
jgi:hypothetical protein